MGGSTLPPPGEAAFPTYYGQPLIRRPHWRWEVTLYFFLGGLAGGAAAVSALTEIFAPLSGRAIVRAGRYLALLGVSLAPPLLIRDLGRPERFHHMLRIFKTRSPMSVGAWGLTLFGVSSAAAALQQMAEDGWLGRLSPKATRRGEGDRLAHASPRRLVSLAQCGLACFVASYTGVLLGFTNVPLWARSALFLGPLFLASGFSVALAALSLIVERTPGANLARARLRRAELAALLAELGLIGALLRRLGSEARPLTRGRRGRLFLGLAVGAGVLTPLALNLAVVRRGGALPPTVARVAAGLTVLGGFALRAAILGAGKESADDPQATFRFTRLAEPGPGASQHRPSSAPPSAR